jgi:hypothetical protein
MPNGRLHSIFTICRELLLMASSPSVDHEEVAAMFHRKFHVNVISRALVVLSFALSAACTHHASAPSGDAAALTSAGDSAMPEIVITASRLHPGEKGYAQALGPSRDPNVKRRGG